MLLNEFTTITENERVKATSLKEHGDEAIFYVSIYPPRHSLIDIDLLKLAFKLDLKRYPSVRPQVGVPGKPFSLKLRAELGTSLTVFAQTSTNDAPLLDAVNYVINKFDTLFLSNASCLIPFESVASDGRTIKMFAPIPASDDESFERQALHPVPVLPLRNLSETLKYVTADFASPAGENIKRLVALNINHFNIESLSPLCFFVAISPSEKMKTRMKDLGNRLLGFKVTIPQSWESLTDDEVTDFFISRPSHCITVDIFLYDPIKRMKIPAPPVGDVRKDVLEATSNLIALQVNTARVPDDVDFDHVGLPDDIQTEFYQLCHDLVAVNNSNYNMPNIAMYLKNVENVMSIVSVDPQKYVMTESSQIFIDCDTKKRDRTTDFAVSSDLPVTENVSSFQLKNFDLSVACGCGATFGCTAINTNPHKPVFVSRSCPSCDELCTAEYLPKIWTPFFNKIQDHMIEVLSENNLVTLALSEEKSSALLMCECSNSMEADCSLLAKGGVVCDSCGAHITIKLQDILFYTAGGQNASSIAHLIKNAGVKTNIEKAIQKLVPGQPLPNFGTCKHYKKSKRAFRFRCCKGMYFPCDMCHEEYAATHDTHGPDVQPLGSSIICGFCSQEFKAPKSLADECVCPRCGYNHGGKATSTGFWNGGKGQRDSVRMNKNDKHKFKNLTKGSKQGTTRKTGHR